MSGLLLIAIASPEFGGDDGGATWGHANSEYWYHWLRCSDPFYISTVGHNIWAWPRCLSRGLQPGPNNKMQPNYYPCGFWKSVWQQRFCLMKVVFPSRNRLILGRWAVALEKYISIVKSVLAWGDESPGHGPSSSRPAFEGQVTSNLGRRVAVVSDTKLPLRES